MRHPRLRHSVILLVLSTAAACQAQASQPAPARLDVAPAPSARFPASWYPPDQDSEYVAPETGAPFSATMITDAHGVDPATGTETTVHETLLRFRDGAGRTRDDGERSMPDGHGGTTLVHENHVRDPVAHCDFSWSDPSTPPDPPLAIVSCRSRILHYGSGPDMSSLVSTEARETETPPDTHEKVEPLGKRNFGEVEAIGARTTVTQKNPETGKAVTGISEIWYSPAIKEIVEMKGASSIQAGNPSDEKITLQMTKIHRGEPDPSLFYPPAGYTIKPDK